MNTTPELSDNETAILRALSDDRMPDEVAEAVCIGSSTVYWHLANMRRLFRVKTNHALVLAAERAGLLPQPEVKA